MTRPLLFLPSADANGPFNMGLDAALLDRPLENPLLRLYGWDPPCVSLGRFQELDAALRLILEESSRDGDGFDITRRDTGGGAIFHYKELTYSLTGRLDALGFGADPKEAYRRVHHAWMEAIAAVLGVERSRLWMPADRDNETRREGEERFFCFTRRTGYDVLCVGASSERWGNARHPVADIAHDNVGTWPETRNACERKLIGSAQRRRRGVLLQHGSIKVSAGPLDPWTVGLEELAGRTLDRQAVGAEVAKHAAAHLGFHLVEWEAPAYIISDAQCRAHEKYGNPDWVAAARPR